MGRVKQPVCEYCGDPGEARFEGSSVCTDCDYRLRQYVGGSIGVRGLLRYAGIL